MVLFAEKFVNNDNGKLYLKTFLIDASLNAEKWGVDRYSIPTNINSFIGKPLTLFLDKSTGQFTHPSILSASYDYNLGLQEQYKIGTIVDVVRKEQKEVGPHDDIYYAISEVTDPVAKQYLLKVKSDKLPLHVSPQIHHPKWKEEGNEKAKTWTGMHLAIVSMGAYAKAREIPPVFCDKGHTECVAELKNASTVETPLIRGNKFYIRNPDNAFVADSNKQVLTNKTIDYTPNIADIHFCKEKALETLIAEGSSQEIKEANANANSSNVQFEGIKQIDIMSSVSDTNNSSQSTTTPQPTPAPILQQQTPNTQATPTGTLTTFNPVPAVEAPKTVEKKIEEVKQEQEQVDPKIAELQRQLDEAQNKNKTFEEKFREYENERKKETYSQKLSPLINTWETTDGKFQTKEFNEFLDTCLQNDINPELIGEIVDRAKKYAEIIIAHKEKQLVSQQPQQVAPVIKKASMMQYEVPTNTQSQSQQEEIKSKLPGDWFLKARQGWRLL